MRLDPAVLALVGAFVLLTALFAYVGAAKAAADAVTWAGTDLGTDQMHNAQSLILVGWVAAISGGGILMFAGYVWHARLVGAEVARALASREE